MATSIHPVRDTTLKLLTAPDALREIERRFSTLNYTIRRNALLFLLWPACTLGMALTDPALAIWIGLGLFPIAAFAVISSIEVVVTGVRLHGERRDLRALLRRYNRLEPANEARGLMSA